jgi:hypothetical protein
MDRIGADALDQNPILRCIKRRCVQCSETVPVNTDCVEYALHGQSTLCAGEQRPALRLDAPVGGNSGVGQSTDLLVLQISRNGSDDCLGRAAGVDLVAFPGGAHADRRGLVIMTDHCEPHRADAGGFQSG